MRPNYTGFNYQAAVIAVVFSLAAGGYSPAAHAQPKPSMFDVMPAGSCEDATSLAPAEAPFMTDNELADTRDEVDFFLVSAIPGDVLQVEARGEASLDGTLSDPVVGHFDSDCNLVSRDDDGGEGLNAALTVEVDDSGLFIIAVTAHADFDFDGGGFFSGSYRLSIDTPPAPAATLSSISVQILDRSSRQPLRGDSIPFTLVTLYSCVDGGCNDPLVDAYTDVDGRVRFELDPFDAPLLADSYQVTAEAEGYQSVRTGVFSVGGDEDYDIGVIVLTPPAIAFSLNDGCNALPIDGDRCSFSVHVDNNSEEPLEGALWSIITLTNIDPLFGDSIFEADADGGGDRRQRISLGSFESGDYGFGFDVPGFTAEGTQFCAQLVAGVDPLPTVNTIRVGALFCIENEAGLFKMLSDAEASKLTARSK